MRGNQQERHGLEPAVARVSASSRMRARRRAIINRYKSMKGCADCGIKDHRVLDLDHVLGVKVAGICTMINWTVAWKKIKAEVKKCTVRCSNCHRVRTLERRKPPAG